MGNWIKIDRKIVNWEWYSDIKVTKLWLHILVKANYKDNTWRGITIKRGQLLTSREKLAVGAGISVSAVRRCLNSLQSTNEITIKTTNNYTLITICNYDSYQNIEEFGDQRNDKQTASRTTNETTNETATTKEYKKDKEYKNNSVVVDKAREIENFRNEIYGSQIKLQNACMATRLDASAFLQYAEEVIARWTVTEPEDISWSHLINAISKKRQEDAKVQNNGEANEKASRRAQLEAFAERCYYESIKPTNKN